jgi:hypothetical protein
MTKKIYLLFLLLFSTFLGAESTIFITLINNSDTNLQLTRAATRSGGRIALPTKVIAPKEQALVLGTIIDDVDLSGEIFIGETKDHLAISVRRLKHFGQPFFIMHADTLHATLDISSLRFNANGKADQLAYTAATVVIDKKP